MKLLTQVVVLPHRKLIIERQRVSMIMIAKMGFVAEIFPAENPAWTVMLSITIINTLKTTTQIAHGKIAKASNACRTKFASQTRTPENLNVNFLNSHHQPNHRFRNMTILYIAHLERQ